METPSRHSNASDYHSDENVLSIHVLAILNFYFTHLQPPSGCVQLQLSIDCC